MKMTKFGSLTAMLLAGALALAATAPGFAAGFFQFPPAGGSQYPTTIPLTGNETIPADTNLASGLNPATEVVTSKQLAGFVGASNPGWRNLLIGGDFGTNLWQRGTTSASITTSALYTADRWIGLSGANTAFTVIKETAAADITTGFAASARVQRTAAQTGVVAVCVGQPLTSANSTGMQGKQVEFQFWAKTGANFSAASSQITATIMTGTGTDQSGANMLAGTWTGQANAIAQVLTIGTTWTKYSAVGTIPATATQVGVKICYTPVGTAGANDWFEFAGAQLDINAAAVTATGVSTAASQTLAFEPRPQGVETLLQQAYYYEVDESAAVTPIATCFASTTSLDLCLFQFPTTMRAVPVFTGDGGFATGFAGTTTSAMTAVSACTSLAVGSAVASTAANTQNVQLACGSAAAFPAAGTPGFLFSNGGTGKIKASAEL